MSCLVVHSPPARLLIEALEDELHLPTAAHDRKGEMNAGSPTKADGTESADWVRETDGSLRLWPMENFSCLMVGGVPAIRIDYLRPPGSPVRTGRLQLHMSCQQARQLSSALLRALHEAES
jgi:hypothetical protein